MGASQAKKTHWSETTFLEEKQRGLDFIDELLAPYRQAIAVDYAGYRNHVVRVFLYSLHFLDDDVASAGDKDEVWAVYRKLAIALAFHDIGLWTAHTVDYLDPSIRVAHNYLDQVNLSSWKQEVGEMIDRHHQILQGDIPTKSLVNAVRLADLADFSWGFVRSGLSLETVRALQTTYPNAGFHLTLIRFTLGRLATHPLNPLPMMRLK